VESADTSCLPEGPSKTTLRWRAADALTEFIVAGEKRAAVFFARAQWDMSTGIVMCASIVLVAPPSISSWKRVCP
jgi:hypothetical protein